VTTAVARQLLHLRRRTGFTQRELARRAGVTASVLCAYETGAREPSARMFQRIVHAAGGTVLVSAPSASAREQRDAEVQDVLALAAALPTRSDEPLLRPTMPAAPP
jgi:transcriptional regulator with XRE-family HTH domain